METDTIDSVEEGMMNMPTATDVLRSVQETTSSIKSGFLDQAAELLKDVDHQRSKPQAPSKPNANQQSKETATKQADSKGNQKDTSRIPGPPTNDDTTSNQDQNQSDEPPRDWSQAKGKSENWKKLHSLRDAAEERAKQFETKTKEYEEKLKTATASPELTKRLDELTKERDQYLSTLEAVAAERSPRFQQQFKPRIDSALKLAIQSVGQEHADTVAKLLAMPDSEYRNQQLESIDESLSGLKQGRFRTAVAEIDKINGERQEFISKGQETWKAWTAESQSQQQRAQQEAQGRLAQAFDSEISEWSNMELLKTIEGNNGHNEEVTRRRDTAKTIFSGGLNPKELARASVWASIGPDLARDAKASKARVAELETELKSLRGSEPSQPNGDKAPEGEVEDSKGMSAGAVIARLVGRQGFLR